jgi:hypothetical protein
VAVFTREQLREWGYEIVDGQAVRIHHVATRAHISHARSTASAPSAVSAPVKPASPGVPAPGSLVDELMRRVEARRDGDTLYLSLPFAPRTKKNSKSWVGVEGRPYRAFRKQVIEAVKRVHDDCQFPMPDRAYNARITFYVDNVLADFAGLIQGLADAIQDAGVISDDWYLRSFDGTEVLYDRKAPRIIVVLEPRVMPPNAPQRKPKAAPRKTTLLEVATSPPTPKRRPPGRGCRARRRGRAHGST